MNAAYSSVLSSVNFNAEQDEAFSQMLKNSSMDLKQLYVGDDPSFIAQTKNIGCQHELTQGDTNNIDLRTLP